MVSRASSVLSVFLVLGVQLWVANVFARPLQMSRTGDHDTDLAVTIAVAGNTRGRVAEVFRPKSCREREGAPKRKISKDMKVKLKSSDDELFVVEKIAAFESQTIKKMVENSGTDSFIPLLNVSSKSLSKVIEYCRYHALDMPKNGDGKPALSEDDIKHWDAEFVEVDRATLFDLVVAANYLSIQSLVDLTCGSVADMIKGKSPEEIRRMFNITGEFRPEEEEEVTRENRWAFE